MKISIIVAMDEKRGIGKENRIPWHIKEDLIKLKDLTRDHVVILGRKTYDSMVWYYNKSGKPMPGKLYIVVTHDKNYKPIRQNSTVVHSVEEALEIAKEKHFRGAYSVTSEERTKELACSTGVEAEWTPPRWSSGEENEIFVIGGGQIYQQALPFADKLYLTIVDGDYNCDTFFPDYSAFKRVTHEEFRESEGYKYKFLEVEM